MREKSIAVLGDRESVLCFRAVGVDVFEATTQDEALKTLKQLARSYQIIYITEQLAILVEDLIARYKVKPYPIVIPIPSSKGNLGVGMNGIKKDVEKAIGTDILFNREEK